MSVQGLPPIDVPQWLRDPHSCKRCIHSYYRRDDVDMRYLMCGKFDPHQQCRYQRHDTGPCGPEAAGFKERSV